MVTEIGGGPAWQQELAVLLGKWRLSPARRRGSAARSRPAWPKKAQRSRIADIQEDVAAKTAADLKSAGLQARALKLDVTSLESAIAAVATVERELGPVDILVNNAGWDKLEPFVESTPETWER